MRSVRYHEIASAVRDRVVAGQFLAGRLLPSEADLSAEFSVSRVTVRRALEVLREAYDVVRAVDVWDTSKEGMDAWAAALEQYNDRVDQVQMLIPC